jgi:hypothetical protein
MRAGIYAALLSTALISSTANAQEAPKDKSLGLTVGASYFTLPDIQTGVSSSGAGSFSPNANGIGLRGSFGLSGGTSIGQVGAANVSIGLSGFADFGSASSTAVDEFSGPGAVSIGGYTTPGNATIGLTTTSGPGNSAASASITHANPQGGGEVITVDSPTNPGGVVNDYAASVASGGNSFGYGAVVTQQGAANTAAAYAAVAASDGGVFFGTGDLTGLKVTTNVTRSVAYVGSDLTLAMSGDTGTMSLQGYAGPSYRMMSQAITTNTSVDIPEASPTTTSFPRFGMIRDERLVSHYIGGVVGFNLAEPLNDTTTLSLGAEGGLYSTLDSLNGSEKYTIDGGSPTPAASTTVNNASGVDQQANGLAWSAHVAPSVTIAVARNRQVMFGGAIDYLSRVATVTRDGTVSVAANTYAGTDDGSQTYNSATNTVTRLAFGPMWSFTPTFSFTGQF